MKRDSPGTGRLVAPPRRAMVGGALVAAAALGVFTAHRSADSPPESRFVVATRQIPAGSTITAEDLGTIALDLPSDIAAVPGAKASSLVGRVTSGDIDELELVTASDVFSTDQFQSAGSVKLAIDLPAARAMQGVISSGQTVSVLSTDPEGSGTVQLTDKALVHQVSSSSSDSIGAAGSVRVVLGVPSTDLASAVVDAAVRTEITLVSPTPVAATRGADSTSAGKP